MEINEKIDNLIQQLDTLGEFGTNSDADGQEQNRKLELELCEEIIDYIKKEDKEFPFADLEKKYLFVDWDEIRDRVKAETINFLRMKPIRNMESQIRRKYYEEIFNIIFQENENIRYICDKLDLNKETAEAFYNLFNYCEHLIITQNFSKRVFQIYCKKYFGIETDDIVFLWRLFENAAPLMESDAMKKQLLRIEKKINYIMRKIDDIEDFIQFLFDDMEDEDSADKVHE